MSTRKTERTFTMVFKDRTKLIKMLHMRRCGWTMESLAVIFGVDHSSIYKACKIHNVHPMTGLVSIDLSSLIMLTGYQPRKVKTYQDYIEEERRRKFPKLYGNRMVVM